MQVTNPVGIRVVALGLVKAGDRVLVGEGYDRIKQETFYRALGGGVEFGETSLEALKREFQEELHTDLTNIHYLGCLENIFVFNGKPGHELIQVYRCDFADAALYQIEQFNISDNDGADKYKAIWIECDRVLSGELILYPDGFINYC